MSKNSTAPKATLEDFMSMLDESFQNDNMMEGSVVKGTVVAIEKDQAIIDVGLKTEGRVPLKEFGSPLDGALKVGDIVEVFLERIENALGEAMLSREKARREESWGNLEKAHEAQEKVNGVIFAVVKGGYTVDLEGATAFLPRSQVDVRPIRDIGPLMNISQPFMILKMDRRRGNIVVSRRSVLEESRAEQRSELVANLVEGAIVDGIVKNITDYGAFVDLGEIDGLLHVTDISWKRITHPSEALNIGDKVKVQIIKINPDTHRISLGMKQLETDPWSGLDIRFPANSRFKGKVTNLTDYGAFIELERGIEGLIHVSEMSWVKKNVQPNKILSVGQEVEAMVLEIDVPKRRVSLGLKQAMSNPWSAFLESNPVGSIIEGEVRNKTEFGLFVGLNEDLDGLVHLNDLDWKIPGEQALETYSKGQTVKAIVLEVDVEKERIGLGIKQLANDPYSDAPDYKKNAVVTCEIIDVKDSGLDVKIVDTEITTFIKRSELSRDRSEQRVERFAKGEKIDARVTSYDKKSRKITLSVKALEMAEEKEAIAQYGSTDSGASLGDILGAALKKGK